ncbi:hypothetical protein [Staphylococcus phage PT94]
MISYVICLCLLCCLVVCNALYVVHYIVILLYSYICYWYVYLYS